MPTNWSPIAGGGAFTEEFVWNRTDVSQFDATSPNYSDGGGSSSTIGFATAAGRGPVIRITGAGTTMNAQWLVTEPITFSDSRRDMRIEIEVASMVPGAGGYFGICLADEAGTYHALCHLPFSSGTNEWASRIDAGTRVTAAATGLGGGEGGMAIFYIRGRTTSGPPQISSYSGMVHGGGNGDARRTGPTAELGDGARAFGDGTALPASWDALALDRIGLAIQSSGGNPAPDVDILDFRVYTS